MSKYFSNKVSKGLVRPELVALYEHFRFRIVFYFIILPTSEPILVELFRVESGCFPNMIRSCRNSPIIRYYCNGDNNIFYFSLRKGEKEYRIRYGLINGFNYSCLLYQMPSNFQSKYKAASVPPNHLLQLAVTLPYPTKTI